MGSIEEYVGHYFSYPGTFEWWRRSKRAMAPKVQEWIDRRVPGPDPQSDYWGITSPASPD